MRKDKQNKNMAETKATKKYLISGAIVLVILISIIFSILKKEKFAIPASFGIPLFEKIKITNVSPSAQGRQEIIFLSKASIVEVFKFYEDSAKKNGFVFINTGLSERKQSPAGHENASASFTLTPVVGRADLLTYFFVLKSQGSQTEVKISYGSFLPEKQNNTDKAAEKIKLPKDFQLKL